MPKCSVRSGSSSDTRNSYWSSKCRNSDTSSECRNLNCSIKKLLFLCMYSQHLEQWPELVIDLFMKWLYYSFMGNVFDHLRPTFVHLSWVTDLLLLTVTLTQHTNLTGLAYPTNPVLPTSPHLYLAFCLLPYPYPRTRAFARCPVQPNTYSRPTISSYQIQPPSISERQTATAIKKFKRH